MYGNNTQQNNSSNTVSVNTKLKTFFGETASLQLGYWNDSLSVKLNPLIGISQDGLRQYDYNRKVNTAITQEKAVLLTEAIEKNLLPLITKVAEGNTLDKTVAFGFPVGNKGMMLLIEYKNDNAQKANTHLTLTSVNPETQVVEASYTYKFAKTTFITKYDANTGEKEEKELEGEFLFFYEKLKDLPNITSTTAHSISVQDAYKSTSRQQQPSSPQQSSYNAPSTTFDGDIPF